jgi:hypothetical protein
MITSCDPAILRALGGAMKAAVQKQVLRSLLLAWIGCGLALPATAQSAGKSKAKWEVEGHFGRISSTNSADGTASLPEQSGAAFTTVNGGTSRTVSSWYFGDGSLLLNQLQTLEPSLPERITPLDPVLAAPLAVRQSGIAFGARLSRAINSRFSGELTLDYGQDRLGIPSEVASQIKATRASFYSTWTSFFAAWKSSSPVRHFGVATDSTIDKDKGNQLLLDATANVALRTTGRMIPYLSGGVGVISNSKGRIGMDLKGSYGTGIPEFIEENDSVSLRFKIPDYVVVGVIGGGIKYFVTPGWGLRFDARTHFAPSRNENLLYTNSGTGTGGGRCIPCLLNRGPTIAFGDTPSIQVTGVPAPHSLSGPPLESFQTFRSSGIQQQIVIGIGVIRRF